MKKVLIIRHHFTFQALVLKIKAVEIKTSQKSRDAKFCSAQHLGFYIAALQIAAAVRCQGGGVEVSDCTASQYYKSTFSKVFLLPNGLVLFIEHPGPLCHTSVLSLLFITLMALLLLLPPAASTLLCPHHEQASIPRPNALRSLVRVLSATG